MREENNSVVISICVTNVTNFGGLSEIFLSLVHL